MSGRSWFSTAEFASQGLLFAAISFQTTNIGTNPDTTKFKGAGGLTGGDGSGTGVANSGPAFISSITKTANNGEFLVTLQDGYRDIWFATGECLSPAAGPGDGYTAQCSVPSNVGQGNAPSALPSFLVTVCNGGTPTETSARTVQVLLVIKNSGSGA